MKSIRSTAKQQNTALQPAIPAHAQERVAEDYAELAEFRNAPNDSRERILYAAMRCVSRLGFAESSMEEVAAEAGVSRATIYRKFSNRNVLFAEVLALRQNFFNQRFSDQLDKVQEFSTVLEQYLIASMRAAIEYPVARELMLGRLDFERPGSALYAVQYAFWRPWLANAQRKGQIPKQANLDDWVQWIMILQFDFAKLTVEGNFTETQARRMIRTFVIPAIRPDNG